MKAAVLVCALLAGCCTTPEPVVVKVPVAVGCLGPVPAKPGTKFGAGEYPGDKAAAQAALLDRLAWQRYALGLEVAQAGCDPKPADQPRSSSLQMTGAGTPYVSMK